MVRKRIFYGHGDLNVGDRICFYFEGKRFGTIERISQAFQRLEVRSRGQLFGINKNELELGGFCPEAYEILTTQEE